MPQDPASAPIPMPSMVAEYSAGSDGAAPCRRVAASRSSSSTEHEQPGTRSSSARAMPVSTSASGAPAGDLLEDLGLPGEQLDGVRLVELRVDDGHGHGPDR